MRNLLVIAIMLCTLTACSDRPQPESQTSPAAIQYLSDFTLPDLEDKPQSIKNWAGRSLVINFWATWCGPCRREMPLLQSLHDQRNDGSLQVIGIALEEPANVKQFISKSNITYPILYGEEEGTLIAESFGDAFIGLPFTAFITADGEVFKLVAGELHADQLNQIVAELDAIATNRQK